MAHVETNLQPPPEFRGQTEAVYIFELVDWAARYHRTLEHLVRDNYQLLTNIAEISQLTQTISTSPTKTEVEAIQSKINEIIAAATTIGS